jgi:hypothetical protein
MRRRPTTNDRRPTTQCSTQAGRAASCRAYNIFVPDAQRQNDSLHKHRRHPIYATETFGLLLIAFLLLVLTLIRYWHAIHWSLR